MSRDEQLVGRFYQYLARWFVLRQSIGAITAWAFLWGTTILILKVTWGTSIPTLLWGAIGLPIALGLAVWLALRQLPDRSAVRAMLDARGGCGGLLMAGAECDLGGWKAKPTTAELPRLQWRGQRSLALLVVSIAYVVLGFLLPARGLAEDAKRLDVNRPADRLADQVRVLQEEKIIEPNRAENMKQKFEDLRTQAAGKDPRRLSKRSITLTMSSARRHSRQPKPRPGKRISLGRSRPLPKHCKRPPHSSIQKKPQN